MPRTRLTKSTIDALPTAPREVVYWDETLPGFGVKVTPAGRKVFIVLYRTGGAGSSLRKYTIGPNSRVTLHLARSGAQKVLGARREGRDPAAEKAEARRKLNVDRVEEAHRRLPLTISNYRRSAPALIVGNCSSINKDGGAPLLPSREKVATQVGLARLGVVNANVGQARHWCQRGSDEGDRPIRMKLCHILWPKPASTSASHPEGSPSSDPRYAGPPFSPGERGARPFLFILRQLPTSSSGVDRR